MGTHRDKEVGEEGGGEPQKDKRPCRQLALQTGRLARASGNHHNEERQDEQVDKADESDSRCTARMLDDGQGG